MSNQWQHGLCGCFDNCGLCILSYFVPCYQFGRNAEAVGESCVLCGLVFLVPGLHVILGAMNRKKIRESKGIEGGIVGDCLLWLLCPLCALVQEAQEVQDVKPQSMARE
ncbi:hypothetical protein ACOMHN_000241 [Nucella lapillus]